MEAILPGHSKWDPSSYAWDPHQMVAKLTSESDGGKPGSSEALGGAVGALPQSGSPGSTLFSSAGRKRRMVRPTTCQVDGCGKDLTTEKAYLQRYLVCERHFKSNEVRINGRDVRFCQQCNKFQALNEFEGTRRSCMVRTRDRNQRRRMQSARNKGSNTNSDECGQSASSGHGAANKGESRGRSNINNGEVVQPPNAFTRVSSGAESLEQAYPCVLPALRAQPSASGGAIGATHSQSLSQQGTVPSVPSLQPHSSKDADAALWHVQQQQQGLDGGASQPPHISAGGGRFSRSMGRSVYGGAYGDGSAPEEMFNAAPIASYISQQAYRHDPELELELALYEAQVRVKSEFELHQDYDASILSEGNDMPALGQQRWSTTSGFNSSGNGRRSFSGQPWVGAASGAPPPAPRVSQPSYPQQQYNGMYGPSGNALQPTSTRGMGGRTYSSSGSGSIGPTASRNLPPQLMSPSRTAAAAGPANPGYVVDTAMPQAQQTQQRTSYASYGAAGALPQNLIGSYGGPVLGAGGLMGPNAMRAASPPPINGRRPAPPGTVIGTVAAAAAWRASNANNNNGPLLSPAGFGRTDQSYGYGMMATDESMMFRGNDQEFAMIEAAAASAFSGDGPGSAGSGSLPPVPLPQGLSARMGYNSGSNNRQSMATAGDDSAVMAVDERPLIGGPEMTTYPRSVKTPSSPGHIAAAYPSLPYNLAGAPSPPARLPSPPYGAASPSMMQQDYSMGGVGGGYSGAGSLGRASMLGQPPHGGQGNMSGGGMSSVTPPDMDDIMLSRLCLKMMDCVPAELPHDMLQRLRLWAANASADILQAVIRPGCTHLILNIRHAANSSSSELAGPLVRRVLGDGDINRALASLEACFASSGLLQNRKIVVQVDCHCPACRGQGATSSAATAALASSTAPTTGRNAAAQPKAACFRGQGAFEYEAGRARWLGPQALAQVPNITSVEPAAVCTGMSCNVVLRGTGLRAAGVRIYARCGGKDFPLQRLAAGADADGLTDIVTVRLPALPSQGLVAFEAASGALLGSWSPAVACQDVEVVEEVADWARTANAQRRRWLLLALGQLMDYDAVVPGILGALRAIRNNAMLISGNASEDSGPPSGELQAITARVPGVQTSPLPANPGGQEAPMDLASMAALRLQGGALSAVRYGATTAVPTVSDNASVALDTSARPSRRLPLRAAASDYGDSVGGAPLTAPFPPSTLPATMAAAAASGGARSNIHNGQDSPGRSAASVTASSANPRLLDHPLLARAAQNAMFKSGLTLVAVATRCGLVALASGVLSWLLEQESHRTVNQGGFARIVTKAAALLPSYFSAAGSVNAAAAAAAAAGLRGGRGRRDSSRISSSNVGGSTREFVRRSSGRSHGMEIFEAPNGFERCGSSSSSTSSMSEDGAPARHARSGLAGVGTLLLFAVESGNAAMVLRVLDWADEHSYVWPIGAAGPFGCTALHTAAAMQDDGDVARLLLSLGQEAVVAWLERQDASGRTPADIAADSGNGFLTEWCYNGEEVQASSMPAMPRRINSRLG